MTFECELSKGKWKKNGLDVDVKWFKGERELKDSLKYSLNRDGCKRSLRIKNLAFEDINNYSVEINKEKCTAQLKVKGMKNLIDFLCFYILNFIILKMLQ